MKKVTVNVPIDVYLFDDGEFTVAYSPLTQVSTYGEGEEDTISAFKDAVALSNLAVEDYKEGDETFAHYAKNENRNQ